MKTPRIVNAVGHIDDELVSGQEYAEKISCVTREQVTECAKRVSIDSVYLLAGEGGKNE